jgi:hypothetical protein
METYLFLCGIHSMLRKDMYTTQMSGGLASPNDSAIVVVLGCGTPDTGRRRTTLHCLVEEGIGITRKKHRGHRGSIVTRLLCRRARNFEAQSKRRLFLLLVEDTNPKRASPPHLLAFRWLGSSTRGSSPQPVLMSLRSFASKYGDRVEAFIAAVRWLVGMASYPRLLIESGKSRDDHVYGREKSNCIETHTASTTAISSILASCSSRTRVSSSTSALRVPTFHFHCKTLHAISVGGTTVRIVHRLFQI